MNSKMKLSYANIIAIYTAMDTILYTTTESGEKVERSLPFRLKYKLSKNLSIAQKNSYDFNSIKDELLSIYGAITSDGQVVINNEEGKRKFIAAINLLLAKEVEVNIDKINTEDFESITENIDVPYDTLRIFQAYVCDEPEFFKTLSTSIDFDFREIAPTIEEDLKSLKLAEEEKPKNRTRKVSNETTADHKEENIAPTKKKTASRKKKEEN